MFGNRVASGGGWVLGLYKILYVSKLEYSRVRKYIWVWAAGRVKFEVVFFVFLLILTLAILGSVGTLWAKGLWVLGV